VGLTHGGLFTRPGNGICLSGDGDGGCGEVYNNFGIDILYGFMLSGSFQLALHGGFVVPAIKEDFTGGLKVGALGRLQAGNVAIVFDPGLYVGLVNRAGDEGGGQSEFLNVPVWVQFQVNQQTMAFVSTGMNGALDGFGDNYVVPLGIGAMMAANNRIDFGAEFLLGAVAGNRPEGIEAFDNRAIIARAALRL
jgi:hypothetical protein